MSPSSASLAGWSKGSLFWQSAMARAHTRARCGSRNSGSSPGALKDIILKALNEGGGGAYLMRQANENPAAFMTLLGRVLPLQVTRANCGPVLLEQIASIALVALRTAARG